MGLIYRTSYEAPLWVQNDSLHLDVLWHAQLVVAINLYFDGVAQAVYYPPEPVAAVAKEMERLCRLALGQFYNTTFREDHQVRQDMLRRPGTRLDMNGPLYEGILLSLPGTHSAPMKISNQA